MAIGFVDDDQSKVGQRVAGVPVLGMRTESPAIVAERGVHDVIIAIPSASPSVRAGVLATFSHDLVRLTTVPRRDRMDSKAEIGAIRDLTVEDVCTRAPISLDPWSIRKLIMGRRVLVTGAAGWIGSEISRQILALAPAQLFLLDRDENGLDRR